MLSTQHCDDCAHHFHIDRAVCPHCGRPSKFPNVNHANDPAEVAALDARYTSALAGASTSGKDLLRANLESIVLAARACRALRAVELQRLSASDSAVAQTYYQAIENSAQPDSDAEFDRVRQAAEHLLFGKASSEIQYAALSPDGRWLESYGDGAVFFRDTMIAHRATLFEENVVLWMKSNSMPLTLPKGYRARWQDRGRLGVAKLASMLPDNQASIPELVLKVGATTKDDSFLEVHFYGPYTIRSVEKVVVKKKKFGALALSLLRKQCKSLGFAVEEM